MDQIIINSTQPKFQKGNNHQSKTNETQKETYMNQNTNHLPGFLLRGFLLLTAMLVFTNCQKDDSVSPDSTLYSSEDAAEAIASNVSTESGGVTDQMSDLSDLATEDGIQNLASGYSAGSFAKSSGEFSAYESMKVMAIDSSYDEGAGIWTITIAFERSNPVRELSANFYRKYTIQYLTNSIAQKYFKVGETRADQIKFDIVEGTGELHSLRLDHSLKSLDGSWNANIGENSLTVAGYYNRAAADTFKTRKAVRTLDYELSLEFAGLVIPAGQGDDLQDYLAGAAMSGHISADITITKGDETEQKSIDKDFTVAFLAKIFKVTVDGDQYSADTDSGELSE